MAPCRGCTAGLSPRSACRGAAVSVLLAVTAVGTLITLVTDPHRPAGRPGQQQVYSRQFLPSPEVGAAAAAASITQLLRGSWRQGAETARALFLYMERPEPCCGRLGWTVPGGGGGGPPICEDPSLAPAAGDSCLVYSFGVTAGQRFERAMAARGCEVHGFDAHWQGAEGHQEAGVVLHRRELSRETSQTGGRRVTLGQTLRELGHAERQLDFLRVDVLGAEWYWLDGEQDSVLRHVKQLNIVVYFNELAGLQESSPRDRNYMIGWYYDTFSFLNELGFCLVSAQENVGNPRRKKISGLTEEKATIWELVWVRRET